MVEHDFECPACESKIASLDRLAPDEDVRERVRGWKEENEADKEEAGPEVEVEAGAGPGIAEGQGEGEAAPSAEGQEGQDRAGVQVKAENADTAEGGGVVKTEEDIDTNVSASC